jgi:biotin carboxyl carrier protein
MPQRKNKTRSPLTNRNPRHELSASRHRQYRHGSRARYRRPAGRACGAASSAGLITIGLLLFGLFALAAIIGTQGAVVGAGEVTVESRVKKIAHPTGGVISAVYVREGQHVKKGDVSDAPRRYGDWHQRERIGRNIRATYSCRGSPDSRARWAWRDQISAFDDPKSDAC